MPYAPVLPLAVDTGPPVPPELDDLLPPRPDRQPVTPAPGRAAKKGSVNRQSEAVAPTPPPWDHGAPSPAPIPDDPSSAATAGGSDPGAGQEVAAPAPTVRPSVKEVPRRLTSSTARDSLAAMALTLIVGTGWNVASARRRRSGWY
ncbi:MAG: hypothetical protein M3357_09180 [Actinomycetota bacterium]|nr:hypothetical protein [Actinomycetota bacterium]